MCVFNTLYILFKYMINYVISSLCLYLTFNTLSFYTHRLHALLFYTLLFFYFLYTRQYPTWLYSCILSFSILCFQGVHKEPTGRVWCATEEADLAGLDDDFSQRYCPHGKIQCLFTLTHPPSVRMTQLSLLLRNKVEKMEIAERVSPHPLVKSVTALWLVEPRYPPHPQLLPCTLQLSEISLMC